MRLKPETDKILVAIQFWEGDKTACMDLMHLIADNEPEHSELADILFIRRFDCKEAKETVEKVSRKFNVFSYRSRRQGTGWPAGCNDLWFSAVEWFSSMMKGGKIPRYKAMFTIEGDGCPAKRNWLYRMHSAWNNAAKKGAKIVGHWQQHPDPHINGNLLVSGDFKYLDWLCKVIPQVPSNHGWDWWLAKAFEKRGWSDTPGITSFWDTPTMNYAWFKSLSEDQSTFYIHGIKDASVRRGFRQLYDL